MRYSLTDYTFSVKVPDALLDSFGSTAENESSNRISIGGDGSYLGSIKASNEKDMFTTEGDSTGSWVHNKSKDRTGTISLEINQLADVVLKLIRLIETYYTSDTTTEGLTITISKAVGAGNSKEVCKGTDCYVKKIPEVNWKDTADTIDIEFTCGMLTFSGDTL